MSLGILLVGAAVVVWGAHALAALLIVRRVPVLEKLEPRPPARFPRVSIVVAARNEAEHLRAALESKLAQDYPDLEVIVVDDRSNDGTGEILDEMAALDPRIKPIHLDRLPEGWLGKVHAMHRGIEVSTGEWILLSDADVYLDRRALSKAIAWSEAEGVDHVSCCPVVWSKGVAFDAIVASAFRLLAFAFRVWAIHDPRSRAALGCGAFNLMRRSAYARTPGLEHLKMEVGDDVALAQMLKMHGARAAYVNARGLMSLEFYPSLGDMARNLEKGAGAGNIPLSVAAATAILFWLFEVSPLFAAVLPSAPSSVRIAAIGLTVWAMLVSALLNRWMDQPAFAAMLFPLGTTLLMAILLRGGLLAAVRGGIFWRGTFYPLKALREGSRFRFIPRSPSR